MNKFKIKPILLSLLLSMTITSSVFISTNTAYAKPKTLPVIVYVTDTGTKYHRLNCKYVKKSRTPILLSKARINYKPCSICKPPK